MVELQLQGEPSIDHNAKRSTESKADLMSKEKQCALCGDTNAHWLKTQSCLGWHHTISQPFCEVSRKYHSHFHLIACYVSVGEFFTRNHILWHPPPHYVIIFWSASNNLNLTLTLTTLTFWTLNQYALIDCRGLLLC